MSLPYQPEIEVHGHHYFPEPYSLNPLPNNLRHGLIPVAILALLSVGATLTLISFICYRLVTWKLHYRTFLGYNQYVLLVLNLLIADLQQSGSFLVSFHWIRKGSILAPSAPCFAQAWLLHSGDVSSGFFVLSIALHTLWTAVHGKRVGHKTFAAIVACIWVFAYFLTGIGVGMHGKKFFVRAGAWCWISSAYEDDRLALHYFWVFLVQFGTVVIYVVTFFSLRHKTKLLFTRAQQGRSTPNLATVEAVNRITKLMTLYPCVYVVLTLPLSAGRMWSMAHDGQSYSNTYALIAGSLITSCGWVDSLLYTLTRRRLLKDTMPHGSGVRIAGSDWADEIGSKGITHTRTVTVEGGQLMDVLDNDGHLQSAPPPHVGFARAYERPPSPNGSLVPILSGHVSGGNRKAEVSVGMQEMMMEDRDQEKQDEITPLPQGWIRHRP